MLKLKIFQYLLFNIFPYNFMFSYTVQSMDMLVIKIDTKPL